MAHIAPQDPTATTSRGNLHDARIKAVYSWVNQLGRTLKTCRLYDSNNPTVVRFRDELVAALAKLLEEHGGFTVEFTADDVVCEEVSLYPARSREDNLALPFYRDGVRSITFNVGVLPREIDSLVESVLQVTGQNIGQDDLVTLLWEAQLEHLEIDSVPSEGDFGGGPGEADDAGELVPWPQPGQVEDGETPELDASGEEIGAKPEGRSDDWTVSDDSGEVEKGFATLETLARHEVQRFATQYEAERNVAPVTTALAILRAALTTGVVPEDRLEFGRFVPRLLRLSIGRGAWLEAREAISLMSEIGDEEGARQNLSQEMLQPISISSVTEHLDQQEANSLAEFIAFAREFGDTGVDFLTLVLGESQQRRNRRLIAEAIADLCRANPERLAPYLSDRRWYVVRNIVHILGWIGTDSIAGMLQVALRHPEPRVRQEAVAALGQVSARVARPMLLKLLDGTEARTFCAVLHQLSVEKHAATAKLVLGFMLEPTFEQRSPEEKRAIYTAISSIGGDEVVGELEAELLKGNWFSRTQEGHRQAVARCLARIGTPLSKQVLERGRTSKRGPVRQACEMALLGFNERD
ncbi:MAG: HEAT repeat domain-containing protein [Candidatus Eisenbacteria bacterium]|uniref:HEAT repeat domain-containing protein n=1 Tax=Eiseniibacteriota bacterium TaxID=2212470 RepID=A0A849SP54_UNCEI|nr:HEAT repeat domain-containing protein [Candidatus Eisenbacteria bacterium]